MQLFTVDRKRCNQDGLCAAVCPIGIISFTKGAFPSPTEEADQLCIGCGHCVAVCPNGCIDHRLMAATDCPPVRKEELPTEKQCEHFLRNRRSIRNYKKKTVPQNKLRQLIEMARYAPSGHNSQGAEWLVLGKKEELQKLAGLVAEWMRDMLLKRADYARALHMDRTLKRWEEGNDVILRGAPALIVAHAEKANPMAPATCYLALTYLELAATSMGLGGCWAGYFNAAVNTFPPMQKALSLPDGHTSFGAMMVGYPKFGYQRLPKRKIPKVTWRL